MDAQSDIEALPTGRARAMSKIARRDARLGRWSWLAVLTVALLAGECAGSSSAGSSFTFDQSKLDDQLEGNLVWSPACCHQLAATKQLRGRHVWCGWYGGWDVIVMHITFVNRLAKGVNVRVQPRYSLFGGGPQAAPRMMHWRSVRVGAHMSRDWIGNLGRPAHAVYQGQDVSECNPAVLDVTADK